MHTTTALLAVSGLATAVNAGTLSVPLSKQVRSDAPAAANAALARRDTSFDIEILNNLTGKAYFTEMGVGTPPQKLSFLVDTGSSDTWVNSDHTEFCTKGQYIAGQRLPPNCLKQFNSDDSSTFEVVNRNFKIGYFDGSSASGVYFNDTVTIGDDATIENQQLGLATTTTHQTGLMGLGMSVAVAATKKYPTILDNLVSNGVIDTPAFSVYLNGLSKDKGSILFGGIDTKKYVGNLTMLPLKPDTLNNFENITSYSVDLKGVTVDGGIEVGNGTTGAIFDTGSTISILPDEVVQPIWDEFNVTTALGLPAPFIDCKYATKKYSKYKFNFEFDGVTITVPLKELVVNSLDDTVEETLKNNIYTRSTFEDFDSICVFGIANIGSFFQDTNPELDDDFGQEEPPRFALLGDTFLRSAYIVYDLANKQLGVAPSYIGSDESNVVALKANSSIPMIKGMDGESALPCPVQCEMNAY